MTIPPAAYRLPVKVGGSAIATLHEVPTPMAESGRCGDWMDKVHRPFIAQDPAQADAAWDWRWEIPLLLWGGGMRRGPRMFQLCAGTEAFSVAMLALLQNERWIEDGRASAVFVWYLTAAPAAVLERVGGLRLVGSAMLDVAIQVALAGPAQGRLWLHAAPEGGDQLLSWYANRGLGLVDRCVMLPG